ncbi:protein of unknown function [Candidatus Nitrosocosmicus franklandus]|uniref:Uncharacterized protein n=1 Tax=Candidatus Nitrosocosmicus franklandianus TaxID=1798806 RepID=A0A484I882_9ARCH|nr:protein of unknown function [Candidatus Nitrosocosmicus franklandus]
MLVIQYKRIDKKKNNIYIVKKYSSNNFDKHRYYFTYICY